MENGIRFVHTNIVARDWRRLAEFYINVFGCTPVYPERNLSGEWIDRVTGIKDVNIQGVHLQLPGYEKGPTLEIFQYHPENTAVPDHKINTPGFAHIAFFADDFDALLEKFISCGGTKSGDKTVQEMHGLGILTIIYVKDPEGNFVEIQNWK